MSAATPSPMPTPDLAGLLRRKPAQATTGQPAPAATHITAPRLQRTTRTAIAKVSAVPTPPPPAEIGEAGERATSAEPGQRQYLRSITVYLPRSVHQRLRAQAATRGTTATALMLEALNRTHNRLAATLTQMPAPVDGADLFDIPQAGRAAVEPSVQTTIRVTDRQHQVITELATTNGTNRSRLITTALGLHLG